MHHSGIYALKIKYFFWEGGNTVAPTPLSTRLSLSWHGFQKVRFTRTYGRTRTRTDVRTRTGTKFEIKGTVISKLHSRFVWVIGYLLYRSHVKWSTM